MRVFLSAVCSTLTGKCLVKGDRLIYRAPSKSPAVARHQPHGGGVEPIREVGALRVGLGVVREEVERGQVLAVPGSITPHTKFEGEVYVLSKDEGGRHTPFFKGYKPQFFFETTDVTGSCELPGGTEMVMPGDNINMSVELIAPIAMEEGQRFAIREGGRTVGAGVVTKIIE